MDDISKLSTEQVNENSRNIDRLSTLEILSLINSEDKKVANAVELEIPQIRLAVDAIYERIQKGGRLFYVGAGTSGRLGVLDAAECPPTYGTDPNRIVGVMAGGKDAMFIAVEGLEDKEDQAAIELESYKLNAHDSVLGIAASGRTPYVIGALRYAKSKGALALALCSVKNAPITQIADISMTPQTGAEVITGSTRMKSGSAQKMILNMISTTLMIKEGKVYGNLMVDVKATNAKLVERAKGIIMNITGVSKEEASHLLEASGGHVKTAVVMHWHHMTKEQAKEALLQVDGQLGRLEPKANK
jgi:N-acetylmuramic acid 6-phosphate etherase